MISIEENQFITNSNIILCGFAFYFGRRNVVLHFKS